MCTDFEGIRGETPDILIERALRVLDSSGSIDEMRTDAFAVIESECVSITADLIMLGDAGVGLREQINTLSRDQEQLSTPRGRHKLRELIKNARVKTFMRAENLLT
jgi:hypothetical protein